MVLSRVSSAANLLTKIQDYRGFDTNIILTLSGRNSYVYREFPGNLESTNLSREILSMEIGLIGFKA